MIDERAEEQASLYVLGGLSADETREFEIALRDDPEMRRLVAALRTATEAMAGTVPLAVPPPSLKQRILDEIDAGEKIIPLQPVSESRRPGSLWLPWTLAACLTIFCGVLAGNQRSLRVRFEAQAARLAELNQMAAALQNDTNNLQHVVAALRETNQLANLRIAMLNSLLADAPKAIAVSLWDEEKQTGIFVAQNLKPLPNDKDYQLWVIDPSQKVPVSAGVMQMDSKGNLRQEFKAVLPIKTAGKFAVTQEPKGGSPTPHLDQLVLLGE